jgi:hypothetical protein
VYVCTDVLKSVRIDCFHILNCLRDFSVYEGMYVMLLWTINMRIDVCILKVPELIIDT